MHGSAQFTYTEFHLGQLTIIEFENALPLLWMHVYIIINCAFTFMCVHLNK